MMKISAPPPPVWVEAPRYCPRSVFPAYRFTPGFNTHPRRPGGHAYGRPETKPDRLSPDGWRDNSVYLFGVDLYHQGYLWESHEAWEALWKLTNRKGAEGQFFQGLIQNASALLKLHLGEIGGAGKLAHEAVRRLSLVRGEGHASFMGLSMEPLIVSLENYFAPVWEGKEAVGSPPRLYLEF